MANSRLSNKRKPHRSRALLKCVALAVALCSAYTTYFSHLALRASNRAGSSAGHDEPTSRVGGGKTAMDRANLDCGGRPSVSIANEMVYWRSIARDRERKSEYAGARKFLTVELDAGGWNNIRLTMEIAMTWARATGRTFVVPPRQGIYLMKDRTYDLHDFYDLSSLDVVDMTDFLQHEVINSGRFSEYPPGNRTDWSEFEPREDIFENENADSKQLNAYLRRIGWSPKWLPGLKLLFVPESPTAESRRGPSWKDRLKEVNFDGRDIVVYDHEPDLIHIMADDEAWVRLMHHFYYTIFFQSSSTDLWIKRYVRDSLHYKDELFCKAGEIVERLRAASSDSANFYTFHIRRGDFSHIGLVGEAQEIVEKTFGIVPVNATIYIATDDQNRDWFKPFDERFERVFYLDDFRQQTSGLDQNFFGFVDQIVASKGEAFFGAYKSTFTAQIVTMMGHYSQINQSPGYETGEVNAYFYAPKEMKNVYRNGYHKFKVNEDIIDMAYPLAWRMIDNS